MHEYQNTKTDKVARRIDDGMADSLGLRCIWFDQRMNPQNEMHISVSLIKAILSIVKMGDLLVCQRLKYTYHSMRWHFSRSSL